MLANPVFFFLLLKYIWLMILDIRLVLGIQHSDSIVLNIMHCTKLLQYYWLYYLAAHYIPMTYLFYNCHLYLLIPFTCFAHSLIPLLWQPLVCSLYQFCYFFFPVFCFFRCYIWVKTHTILSFSVWLISLCIIPSRSIYIVANGKISFFFMAE